MLAQLKTPRAFLPVSLDDAKSRGWPQLDVVLVNGDAYVDHPTFGVPLRSGLLASRGYKVGIVSQPRWDPPPVGTRPASYLRHAGTRGRSPPTAPPEAARAFSSPSHAADGTRASRTT